MTKECNCEEVCQHIPATEYVNACYHHGLAEGLYRSPVCACGFWRCAGRGCGDCPDCYGEHCECHLPDDQDNPAERFAPSTFAKAIVTTLLMLQPDPPLLDLEDVVLHDMKLETWFTDLVQQSFTGRPVYGTCNCEDYPCCGH